MTLLIVWIITQQEWLVQADGAVKEEPTEEGLTCLGQEPVIGHFPFSIFHSPFKTYTEPAKSLSTAPLHSNGKWRMLNGK